MLFFSFPKSGEHAPDLCSLWGDFPGRRCFGFFSALVLAFLELPIPGSPVAPDAERRAMKVLEATAVGFTAVFAVDHVSMCGREEEIVADRIV